jgi:hypothetical protein
MRPGEDLGNVLPRGLFLVVEAPGVPVGRTGVRPIILPGGGACLLEDPLAGDICGLRVGVPLVPDTGLLVA